MMGIMNSDPSINKIGHGEFGDIYCGARGDFAVNFLLGNRGGEVRGAFVREDLGEIDLIWGEDGSSGYGLAKIAEKHPEAIFQLALSVEHGKVVKTFPDRKIIIADENGQKSVIDLRYKDTKKIWLVTSYIPTNPIK
jgi:Holliday junction resolvase-like predicted endonuclease